ncbi:hypothetical protein LEP48_10410 [Isoptericola sp. NEAU-Y5]|uniref:Uncharacterized protein n=1 Tax=Isoptericola luteus TaxID=2879484 RepID=A0ABS7ZFG4_9MICO|nr:hypothetical protein [Isoptericola sp. NEAU-Y5]MCA5893759.1 hypothetical protein [Isoptericola sp. NEAU-Y5]
MSTVSSTEPRRPVHRRAAGFFLSLAVALTGALVAAPSAHAADRTAPTRPVVSLERWLDPKGPDFAGLYAWKPRATWTKSRDSRGVTGYQIQTRVAGEREALSGWSTVGKTWRSAGTRSYRGLLYDGGELCIRVRARDAAGNKSAWSKTQCTNAPLVPILNFDVNKSVIQGAAHQHAYAVVSTRNSASLSTRTRYSYERARTIRLSVRTGPDAGRMKVYVGKRYAGTVDARSSTKAWRTRKVSVDRPTTGRIRLVPVTKAEVRTRFVWVTRG